MLTHNNDSHVFELQCPRCGHRAVVTKAEHHYVCLNCGWERNISQDRLSGMAEFFAFFIITLFLLLLIFA
ncbi:MAG: hypothetical protein ACKO24_18525 [Leptolyngbyaceae cyanobacterium]